MIFFYRLRKALFSIRKRKYRKQVGTYEYKKQKETIRNFVIARVEHFNQFYNFTFNKITIRNSRTRWGSCSKKGNLNFNYRIISLPQQLQDYIVVHELCHLKEMNHSKSFWDLVAQVIPDYKKVKQILQEFRFEKSDPTQLIFRAKPCYWA